MACPSCFTLIGKIPFTNRRKHTLSVRRLAAVARIAGCLILFSGIAIAQSSSVSVGTVSGGAGSAVDLSVSLSPGASSVSTLQFDLTFPASLSYVSTATGSASSSAGKSAAGSAIAGGARIVVFGYNQTPIGSGQLAAIRLNIASGTIPGVMPVTITGLVASDPSGNAVTLLGINGTVTVIDIMPPTVVITTPTSNATYSTSSSPISIGGTASDNVGVAQITWSNDRGGSGTATGTTNWSASGIVLQSGVNAITVVSRDAANNASTDTLTITYTPPDTTPPTVAITTPTSSSTYNTISNSVNIGGTASDNVGVTQVTWANNRGGSGTATGTTSWSASGIALQSGSNIIVVTARDAAANSTTASLTVTYTPCTYSLSSSGQTAPPGSSTGSVAVSAPAGCAWTASSNQTWAAITSGTAGNGNGTIGYAVAVNTTSAPRSGVLTIAGQAFTIAQAKAGCDPNLDSVVNVVDIQALINVILGITTCPANCDVNSDGSVNVVDLQTLNNVILGVRGCP
jgi:hypothetical protein